MIKTIKNCSLPAIAIAVLLSLPATSAWASDLRYCRQGWAQTEAGNFSAALELFERCRSSGNLSKPDLIQTYRNIGITYRLAGMPAEALAHFDKALELGPDHRDYVNRGNALSDMGRFEEAKASYAKVDRKYREAYLASFYDRAVVEEKQGRLDAARKIYQQALEEGVRTKALIDRASLNGVIDSVGKQDQVVYQGMEGFTFLNQFKGERFRGWRFMPKGETEANWNRRIILAISSLAGRNDEERAAYAKYFTNSVLSQFIAPCAKSRMTFLETPQRQFPSVTGIAFCDGVDRGKLQTSDTVRKNRVMALKYVSTGQALYALEYTWQSDTEPADSPANIEHFDLVAIPLMNLFGVYN